MALIITATINYLGLRKREEFVFFDCNCTVSTASQVLCGVLIREELRGEEREGLIRLLLLVREEELVYTPYFFLFYIIRQALPVVQVGVIRNLESRDLHLGG